LVKVSRWEEQAPKNTNTNPKIYRTCLRMYSCYESSHQIRAFASLTERWQLSIILLAG